MIRLHGIDAPDPARPAGHAGRGIRLLRRRQSQLQQMLDLGEVTCIAKEQDRNQNRIGVCRVLGKDCLRPCWSGAGPSPTRPEYRLWRPGSAGPVAKSRHVGQPGRGALAVADKKVERVAEIRT